ncbi:MAG: SDR family NAD(P)-dependent oxidoreductase [Methylococcaceae bacterium]|nr:SDR family NAD(P)-dependent oxidoreductase [Methylococcaceae bacterium]
MHILKRTILVTGASSGIGRATAKHLLQQGHTVIGTSRDSTKFKISHQNFSFIEIDFSQLDTIPTKIKQLEKSFPKLDAVVFSAGYGQFGSLEQFSFNQIEQMMMVNFTSHVFITRTLIPRLKRKKQCNLIYIGSEAALKGTRKGSIYCASKFALRGFTQALRDECSTSSIHVSLINPGMVNTAFFDTLSFQPGDNPNQALQAEDIAETVSYILNTSKYSIIDEINLNPANKVINFKK